MLIENGSVSEQPSKLQYRNWINECSSHSRVTKNFKRLLKVTFLCIESLTLKAKDIEKTLRDLSYKVSYGSYANETLMLIVKLEEQIKHLLSIIDKYQKKIEELESLNKDDISKSNENI